VLCIPVRLSVLAPGELVPSDPAVIRAPFDGVVAGFLVKPNDVVKAGQPLLNFDDATVVSRLEVAKQALATAEAEYRQTTQQALADAKYKAQLVVLAGKIEERRAEVAYLQGQLERARVVAPRDGVALFDDPSEWVGRPVVTGERILRVAAADQIEVEAWVGVDDAIPLEPGAPVTIYLNASPFSPVDAKLRYLSHDAVQRPDGAYAYRARAKLEGKSEQRVGMKGTAKLSGRWVPLAYWVLRRPVAAVRQLVGW
jgi:multidrug resistance efflux pump